MSERIMLQEPEPEAPEPKAEPKPAPPEPVAPPPPPEPVEPAAPPGDKGDKPEPAEPAPEGETPEQARQRDLVRMRDRLSQAERDKWEARRQAETYAARLAELERPQPPPGQPQDPVEVAKQQLRAEQMQREFNQACNKVFEAGKSEFPDFEASVSALNAVGASNRPDFLSAVSSLPEGHRVYRELAADLNDAARVLAMPPMQMAVELARRAVAAGAPKTADPPAVSNAPAPIRPLGGSSRNPNPATETMAEFITRRDKEAALKRRI